MAVFSNWCAKGAENRQLLRLALNPPQRDEAFSDIDGSTERLFVRCRRAHNRRQVPRKCYSHQFRRLKRKSREQSCRVERSVLRLRINRAIREFGMKLSLFAKYGLFDQLALAPSQEALPNHQDWSLSQKDAIESERLMLDQQAALLRNGFVFGRARQ